MNLNKLLLGCLAAGALAGCATNAKFVTTIHELNDKTFYVAYTDYTKSMMGLKTSYTAAVRKCDRQPDKSVTCTEQTALNSLLNAENTQK